jgi:DNA-binding CsgD family transcriptional regulator
VAGGSVDPLTDREREIAFLAANEMTSREIAERLFLSYRTVNNHLQHIYDKLGIRGRSELRNALGTGQD